MAILDFDLEKPVVIPVVLHHLLRDHIVGFYIHPGEHTIEFFDSQGLSICDRGNDLIRGFNNQTTLLGVAYQILGKCKEKAPSGKPWAFKENTRRMQKDSHNCGIYVRDFFDRRIAGKKWDKIQSAPLSFSEANGEKRQALMMAIRSSGFGGGPQHPLASGSGQSKSRGSDFHGNPGNSVDDF